MDEKQVRHQKQHVINVHRMLQQSMKILYMFHYDTKSDYTRFPKPCKTY